MRISSTLSLLACTIGFLSLLTPVTNIEDYVITWIDLHESPPLWIFIAATFLVAAHDIKWLDGINFIRKSNNKIIRAFLIFVAIGMAFALELSTHVALSGNMYWTNSLLFRLPPNQYVIDKLMIGYHLIKLCRLILIFSFFEAIIEKSPRKLEIHFDKDYKETLYDKQP
ncbi:MAG: hypothetical protein KAS63_08885 [Candidatus Heimdallarchaeota archaeon]|nr:hypothetical protein [Candidatus Heimdallarchaeota archaeon]MCK4955463.1 hypothetical protein [Candidatus Heimdallarchaeota archaeon]